MMGAMYGIQLRDRVRKRAKDMMLMLILNETIRME